MSKIKPELLRCIDCDKKTRNRFEKFVLCPECAEAWIADKVEKQQGITITAAKPVIVGIDAGVKGAMAWWDGNEMQVESLPILPDHTLNALALVTRLMELEPILLVSELTFKPLSLIRMTGAVLGCGQIAGAATEMPAVSAWKCAVLGKNTSDKELSIAVCQKLYPYLNLLPTPRCKKPSHDYADAALQAHWGRMRTEGKT